MKAFSVLVKTKAKKTEVVPQPDGSLVVRVPEAPDKGKANTAVIKALARHFHLSPSQVVITRGETSKSKTVQFIPRNVS